jgi:hypothetical protein
LESADYDYLASPDRLQSFEALRNERQQTIDLIRIGAKTHHLYLSPDHILLMVETRVYGK